MADWYLEIKEKDDNELDLFIDSYQDTYSDFLRDLVKVMKEREYKPSAVVDIENELKDRKRIKKIVDDTKIKTKTSFKLTPKFYSELSTYLPNKIALQSTAKVAMTLGWPVVHFEDNIIETKTVNRHGSLSEKVIIVIDEGKLSITSTSIENNLCDFGKNSKRVEEFKIAYKEIESFYDEDKIAETLEELTLKEEKDKYQIPEELRKPKAPREKKIAYLVIGGLLLSMALGGVIAFAASLIYVVFLFDFLIGLGTGYAFSYLIKLSNISNFYKVRFIGFASVGLSYFLSQVYRFIFIVNQNDIIDASIIDYFIAKLENGLQYRDLNMGMIGLIVAWVFEVTIALIIFNYRAAQEVIQFDLENAPADVVNFAMHWFNEDKDEDEVRTELHKKGWENKEQQDLIFKAVSALATSHQMNRE
jgi:hypothetical protein